MNKFTGIDSVPRSHAVRFVMFAILVMLFVPRGFAVARDDDGLWATVDTVPASFPLVVGFEQPGRAFQPAESASLVSILDRKSWAGFQETIAGAIGDSLPGALLDSRWVVALGGTAAGDQGWVLLSDADLTLAMASGKLRISPRENHRGVPISSVEGGGYLLAWLPSGSRGETTLAICPRSSRGLLHQIIDAGLDRKRPMRGAGAEHRKKAGIGAGDIVWRLELPNEDGAVVSASMRRDHAGWRGVFSLPARVMAKDEAPRPLPISSEVFSKLALTAQAATGGALVMGEQTTPWAGVLAPQPFSAPLDLAPGTPTIILLDARRTADKMRRASIVMAFCLDGPIAGVSLERDEIMKKTITAWSGDAAPGPSFGGVLSGVSRRHTIQLDRTSPLHQVFGNGLEVSWGYASPVTDFGTTWWIVGLSPEDDRARLSAGEVVRSIGALLRQSAVNESRPILGVGDLRPSALASVEFASIEMPTFERIDRVRWEARLVSRGTASGEFVIELLPDVEPMPKSSR